MPEARNANQSALEAQIGYIVESIKEIKGDLKELKMTFASKEEMVNLAQWTRDELDDVRQQLKEVKQARWVGNVVGPIVSALVSAAFTFLMLQYLQSLH